ncbi:hypothetical protein D3C75_992040 [compost metagenome]
MFQSTTCTAEVAQRGQRHVFLHRHPQHQTITFTVFGDIDDTVGQTVLRSTSDHFMAIQVHGAAFTWRRTVQDLHQLGTPSPHQASHTQNLTTV